MSEKKILSNLRWSKYFILITNLGASILFFIAYKLSSNVWFLVTAIVLFIVMFAAAYFFIRLEAKFKKILNTNKSES